MHMWIENQSLCTVCDCVLMYCIWGEKYGYERLVDYTSVILVLWWLSSEGKWRVYVWSCVTYIYKNRDVQRIYIKIKSSKRIYKNRECRWWILKTYKALIYAA